MRLPDLLELDSDPNPDCDFLNSLDPDCDFSESWIRIKKLNQSFLSLNQNYKSVRKDLLIFSVVEFLKSPS